MYKRSNRQIFSSKFLSFLQVFKKETPQFEKNPEFGNVAKSF
jgi:hypothetical protein